MLQSVRLLSDFDPSGGFQIQNFILTASAFVECVFLSDYQMQIKKLHSVSTVQIGAGDQKISDPIGSNVRVISLTLKINAN
jgi:hypothetical protein